jgi:hypothetical protein
MSYLKLVIALSIFAVCALAQAANHNATLSWTDTVNPAITTYNVYRCTGAGCTNAVKIASAVALKTYVDTAVVAGSVYVYQVRSFLNNLESTPMSVTATIPFDAPVPVTGLGVTVQ